MAGAPSPLPEVRETPDLIEADVFNIPDDLVLEVRAREDEARRLDPKGMGAVRPHRAATLAFLVGVTVLGLWGILLGLYLVKSYLGIDLLGGTSLGWAR